ncbi:Sec-independent protein translocase protein TatB [Pseudomonas sp. 5P_3.1_Bac2]|uniref:Sec-independent protein translocase protein TatB n=1 Tax=Pseudomonas sp. 5P_3.1_Bac2 TaxID=2971617 RepID=UPI0021C5F3EC|nr:Sec-independent protein translocase protein TatB [Pseudomonas sp. 5P_3.1_Bac2]MCU1717862.1 Sec-independent protein translocase protein TatB [Pseudomonas sp. 5P_3.1_Bac2]
MFDIGFSELVLVGLVALVVLGPERLPGAVRTAGLWIGRIKRSFNAIKQQVEQELGADEIRRQLHNEQILQLEREMAAMKQELIDAGKLAPPTPNAAAEPTPGTPQATPAVHSPEAIAAAPAAPATATPTAPAAQPEAVPSAGGAAPSPVIQDKPQS